jgi:hypothetical protein
MLRHYITYILPNGFKANHEIQAQDHSQSHTNR